MPFNFDPKDNDPRNKNKYVKRDKPAVSLVLTVFIAWGINETAVKKAAK